MGAPKKGGRGNRGEKGMKGATGNKADPWHGKGNEPWAAGAAKGAAKGQAAPSAGELDYFGGVTQTLKTLNLDENEGENKNPTQIRGGHPREMGSSDDDEAVTRGMECTDKKVRDPRPQRRSSDGQEA